MDNTESAARGARRAGAALARLDASVKSAVLSSLADRLERRAGEVAEANAADLDAARAEGLDESRVRRLVLTPGGLTQLAEGVRQIAAMPDPVHAVTRSWSVPSGLEVERVRTPLGVVLMIYEARPGVTIDAFALCFKAGNACLLKGGREAGRSNAALLGLARESLVEHGAPEQAVSLITTGDREELRRLLSMSEEIDLVIPRGGEGLIRFVREHSRIPTVQHFKGVCHIYVDESADVGEAVEICATAKTSAPATCNAAECVLVHRGIAGLFVPAFGTRCEADGVEIRGDEAICALAPTARAASADDWGREHLDLIVSARVVGSMDEAIEHIARYGSSHTEAILTRDGANAARFCREVTSSCVVVNASTRFNDGYQLGLGAEIGISTSRVHWYGPMGLEGLTCERFVVRGNGQRR